MTLIRQDTGSRGIIFLIAALVIALSVFAVDTSTQIEGGVAVLYAIALLLFAEAVNRLCLVLLTTLFMLLSLRSFFRTHALEPDLPTFLRLCAALAAPATTTALLMRNENSRTALLQSNAALRES